MSVMCSRIRIPINERVYVSPPPYDLDCIEISCPNVPLNKYDGPFCLQCMNIIEVTKPAGRQCNRLLDEVVKILKYKKRKFYHAIYIKVFSDENVSYLKFYTDDVLNTTNNETAFTELTRFFEE